MEQRKQTLRLKDIIHIIKKNIVLIMAFGAIGLAVGAVLSFVSYMRGEMQKQYAITTSIAVTSQNENGLFTGQSRDPESQDIYLAENMVDSVIYVLKSDKTLKAATDKLDLAGISTKDIYNNLNITQYGETQIIEITLYWRSDDEGVAILNALNEVSPNILIKTLKLGNVSVINEPKSKYLIGGNINISTLGYMAVIGAFIGAAYSILMLLIKPTLLNTGDMEHYFGVDVIGEIPESSYFQEKQNLLSGNPEEPEIIDHYISAAHILKIRLWGMENPCVCVTSAANGEGTTSVTANLGVRLSEIGLKVLLIDFDTRNPKLGGLFLPKVEYERSINALYKGKSDKDEAITRITGTLDILPAVLERVPIPLDDALFDIINSVRKDYDVILIDTAPVGQAADTMSLTLLADAALLVVKFDCSSLEQIGNTKERLDKAGMKTIGCIINAARNNNLLPDRENTRQTKSRKKKKSKKDANEITNKEESSNEEN